MTYTLFIHADLVRLASGNRAEYFDTTGPDDPRITEAIARCRAAGFTINTTRL